MLKQVARNLLPHGLMERYEEEGRKETHINRALRTLRGEVYVEIGVRFGLNFRKIRAKRKIGIDPCPRIQEEDLSGNSTLYRMTSDEFFEVEADRVLRPHGVDVALVDGLHEFRQALRDVLNLERYMTPAGVVFLHDCNPAMRSHATEEYHEGQWNGDVWKAMYYLRKHRPDLKCFTLNCDFGLGVVTGFRPDVVPPTPDPAVVDACKALDFDVLALDRKQILGLRSRWYGGRFMQPPPR